jgi:hypothetical protein
MKKVLFEAGQQFHLFALIKYEIANSKNESLQYLIPLIEREEQHIATMIKKKRPEFDLQKFLNQLA